MAARLVRLEDRARRAGAPEGPSPNWAALSGPEREEADEMLATLAPYPGEAVRAPLTAAERDRLAALLGRAGGRCRELDALIIGDAQGAGR